MATTDRLGNPVSAATEAALDGHDEALRLLQCYRGDPVAAIERTLAAHPDFVMGHVLHAWLHLLGTEPAALPVARADVEQALRRQPNHREQAHLQAISAFVDGRWHDSKRRLEDLTIAHPLDALALQAGHVLDFYTGDARLLRDRIARALPAWSPSMPGYHALLGMHAFGLEETGAWPRAEAAGRAALELEPRDGWAHHAVAHVFEMQGRQRAGIAWMRERGPDWADDSFLAVHNWWHLALYHLDLDDVAEVLALFDGPVFGARSALALDLVDAAALLWRLRLRGADVGERWQPVADGWAALVLPPATSTPSAHASHYAFNDAHAAMAFLGAGRADDLRQLIESQQHAMALEGDNAGFTRDVGAPLVQALVAFDGGDHRRAVELLRPLRAIAHLFGGSHAQRDLIDLTLVESALRGSDPALARALVAERLDARPPSPAAVALQRRAATM